MLVTDLFKAPNLREILDELEKAWTDEQNRRHEFWADVDENQKAEFIMGEIIFHSPIYGRHWKASTRITRRLIPYVYDNNLGEVAYEKAMIRLTRNDYEPDICFWRKEKAIDFGAKQSAFPAPDFVLEILSDSTKDRDYGIKMTDYALHDIKEYWIVDTEHHSVEQYILKNKSFELSQKLKEGFITSEIIEGFSISLKEIFK